MDLEEAVRGAAEGGRAVVGIGRGRDGGPRGAGVLVGEGLVLTSAHNLRGETVSVFLPGAGREEGQVKGVDLDGDLAVVAVQGGGGSVLEWSDDEPVLGRAVFALAPLPGRSGVRVTAGHVSAVDVSFRGPRGQLITGAFEHTCPLVRGSSGGPVVDGSGRLLGVNTHRLGDSLYLAIPATPGLRTRVEALGRGEVPARRRLGVALVPSHVARRLREAVGLPPRDGLLVREVDPEGPAARAGVAKGDLIVAAAGRGVGSLDDLVRAVDEAPDPVEVTVVRGAEEVTVEVRFEAAA